MGGYSGGVGVADVVDVWDAEVVKWVYCYSNVYGCEKIDIVKKSYKEKCKD